MNDPKGIERRPIGRGALAGAALVGVAAGALAMAGWSMARGGAPGDMTEAVRTALLENPEIIPEAMERLQQREAAEVVEANRAALETPFGGAWAGAEQGEVVLVEFFDYACGFCRASNADVERLLAEDAGVKLVWRELPVLGPDSEQAAVASLAAARGGRDKYQAFHQSLFALGRPTDANVVAAAERAGVAPAAISAAAAAPEVEAELRRNIELARAIGASGTPTFVVGDQVLQGAVGYEALKQAVAQARGDAT